MLLSDKWNGALRLRFDDPGRRNALSLDVVRELHNQLLADPQRTVVLGSADPVAFSSGVDTKVADEIRREISAELYACYRTMITRPGPVIAVVEGTAVGGGAQLTTAADLRLAGPGARWRWVGAGHGLVVGAWVLPTLIGGGRANELILTSRWVSALEAVAIGLVSAVHDDPWAEADRLLRHLSTLDPSAVDRLKQCVVSAGLVAALETECRANEQWEGRMRRPPAGTGLPAVP